jgi:hypothetical protein
VAGLDVSCGLGQLMTLEVKQKSGKPWSLPCSVINGKGPSL